MSKVPLQLSRAAAARAGADEALLIRLRADLLNELNVARAVLKHQVQLVTHSPWPYQGLWTNEGKDFAMYNDGKLPKHLLL